MLLRRFPGQMTPQAGKRQATAADKAFDCSKKSMALLGVKKRKAPEQPRHYIVDGAHDFPSWLSRQLQKIRKRARQSPSTLANDRFPSSATPHNAGSRQSRNE